MNVHYRKQIFQNPNSIVDFHWFCGSSNRHSHDYYEIFIIVDGDFTHKYKKQITNLSKGDAVLVVPNKEHFLESKQDTLSHLLNFSISKEVFENITTICGKNNLAVLVKNSGIPVNIDKKYLDLLISKINTTHANPMPDSTALDFFYLSIIHELLGLILTKSLSNTEQEFTAPIWLKSFLNEISNPEIFCQPISTIYKLSNYSPSQFSLLFKKYVGKTLVQYVTMLRIDYAKNLLTKTNFSIEHISVTLNYFSLSHFIRIFKRETNLTPMAYRKKFYIYLGDNPDN